MPETKEQMLREIDRLTQWVDEMAEMLNDDATVPASMRGVYERQGEQGEIRLKELQTRAKEMGWL
jgi:hypothetical protein